MSVVNILIAVMLILLFTMVILLCVLAIYSFKSKTKPEEKKEITDENGKPIAKKANSVDYASYTKDSVCNFMEFDKIEDNMIIQKDGKRFLMVVECQGVNYDLMSEEEKNGVEEGFIQFLNTLRHPIQIYVQTRTIDLGGSIETYKNQVKIIEEELNNRKAKYEQMLQSGNYPKEQLEREYYELTKDMNLYEYGKDIIYTTERMSLNKNVLNKKYYVIVPYSPEDLGGGSFDKEEIKNIAFSELYTRAQSIGRTLAVCGINAKILDSNELVELLYIAYNRDEAEVFGLNKAMKAGYDELYSTAPDVMDKKMAALDKKIEDEAYNLANSKVMEAKSDKAKAVEAKEESLDDLIENMAKLIVEQSAMYVGEDIAQSAEQKIEEDAQKRKAKKKGGEQDGVQKQIKQTTRTAKRA